MLKEFGYIKINNVFSIFNQFNNIILYNKWYIIINGTTINEAILYNELIKLLYFKPSVTPYIDTMYLRKRDLKPLTKFQEKSHAIRTYNKYYNIKI